MDMRFVIALALLGLLVAIGDAEAGGLVPHHRKIIIHVPVHKEQEKHVHTIVKHIHHHHKPIVIKEEKIIKHEVHPIVQEKHVSHDHMHHHHQYEHAVIEQPKEEVHVPHHYEHEHHGEEIEHEK